MALWMIRAGKNGQFENQWLEESRIYLNWGGLHDDLHGCTSRDEVSALLEKRHPDFSMGKRRNHGGQIHAFLNRMMPGDWVIVPSKFGPYLHVGEIVSGYKYDANASERLWHSREVKWLATEVPRSAIPQDILYSLGAIMTICQIQRNDSENRIRTLARNNWQPSLSTPATEMTPDSSGESEEESGERLNIPQAARDQLARQIRREFPGYQMQALVEAVLKAMGYSTYVPPEGPDGGIDILAGSGPLGFEEPRICVQVKATEGAVERIVMDQLIGTMQKVGAGYGLLVSWGGFRKSYKAELAQQYFRVRLWDQNDLIEHLLQNYERMPESIRAELPLQRVWCLASGLDEDT